MSSKNRNNLYIPSVDAKDIFIANNYINKSKLGYSLFKKNGDVNFNKYKNSFDYSLDLIDLKQIADNKLPKKDALSFIRFGKEYSNKIINITFKYAVKEFNRVSKDLYIRFGYNYNEIDMEDGKSYGVDEEGNRCLVAIQLNTYMKTPVESNLLPDYFIGKYDRDMLGTIYSECKNIPTLFSARELRTKLYSLGFYCNGKHYVRYKRSSGSARVGKVLFIDERLYASAHKSEQCGLNIKLDDEVDLAGFEAYIALPTSSIIDTIPILPENILVIEDYDSIFKETAVCTYEDEDHHLHTEEKEMTISNSIWDGQSLIEKSLMGNYSDKGMLLLRNKFFKSCCFSTNIQMFFKDNGITSIDQLKGITVAKKIEDIKLITTKKSIKFFKFGKYETWLQNIYPEFGVVKYEKDTHFFDGEMVQAHYQLLNTLQLSEEDVEELVQPGLDYINLLNTDPDVMRYHIGCSVKENGSVSNVMKNKNEIIYHMLKYDCGFENTKIYYDFKKEMCHSYMKNMKRGHILINGTYATLFGNPYEMLMQSIGKFNGESYIGIGNVYNTRFAFESEILCCRSPHVTIGNLMVVKNKDNAYIKKYFNLSDKIICLNAINENSLERLSGADYDSDQAIITQNPILVNAAKKYYDLFKVPTRDINPTPIGHKYNPEMLSKLDFVTGTNKIGEIVNFSQELNSLLWDIVYKNGGDARSCYDLIKDIYYDVCQLDVMSNIEIDKAKKEFKIVNGIELRLMKEKYHDLLADKNGHKIMPTFLGYIARLKKYRNVNTKVYKKYKTSMDIILQKIQSRRSNRSKGSDFISLAKIFKFDNFDNNKVNYKSVDKIIDYTRNANKYISYIYARQELSNDEKQQLIQMQREELIENLNNMKLNEHTLYRLITRLDQKENSDISSLLFFVLFNYENTTFTNIITELKKHTVILSKDSDGDIQIYGKKYKKIHNF